MNDGGNRIGTVSHVDLKTGMISVVYEDRNGEVTDLLPYATFNDEYKLPKLGAKVIVMHLSNGGEMGIAFGTYWNESNTAKNPKLNPKLYHKDLGDDAYIEYDGNTLTIASKHTRLQSLSGKETYQEFEVEELLQKIHSHEERIAVMEKMLRIEGSSEKWPLGI